MPKEEVYVSKRSLTQAEKIRLQKRLNDIYQKQYEKKPCAETLRNVEEGRKDLLFLERKS